MPKLYKNICKQQQNISMNDTSVLFNISSRLVEKSIQKKFVVLNNRPKIAWFSLESFGT